MDEEKGLKQEKVRHMRAAAALVEECMTRFFRDRAPEQYQIEIDLEEENQLACVEAAGLNTPLRFHLPDGQELEGCLVVDYEAGNMYGVTVWLSHGYEDEHSINIPVHDPEAKAVRLQIDGLSRRVLAELERVTGERAMQAATEKRSAKK